MGFFANPFGYVGLAGLVIDWAVAVAVFASQPGRATNRLLAIVLLFDGAASGCGNGLKYLVDRPEEAIAFHVIAGTATWVASCMYLLFLSRALDTRLVAPFRTRAGTGIAVTVAAVGAVAFLAVPASVGTVVHHAPYAPWDVGYGPGALLILLGSSGALIFGLVAAISFLRGSPRGTAAHSRARAYVTAFALRDGVFTVMFILLAAYSQVTAIAGMFAITVASADVVWAILLAYGILRYQMLDIDLRIKWTLRRGSVAAAFVSVFLVASAVAEQYLQQYGYLVGGIAVGLLLLVLRPLQRAADRLADRAMPSVRDTREYRRVRRSVVYRAAVESALQDGVVTEKERDVLATLADQLGISAGEARAIERDASGSPGP